MLLHFLPCLCQDDIHLPPCLCKDLLRLPPCLCKDLPCLPLCLCKGLPCLPVRLCKGLPCLLVRLCKGLPCLSVRFCKDPLFCFPGLFEHAFLFGAGMVKDGRRSFLCTAQDFLRLSFCLRIELLLCGDLCPQSCVLCRKLHLFQIQFPHCLLILLPIVLHQLPDVEHDFLAVIP